MNDITLEIRIKELEAQNKTLKDAFSHQAEVYDQMEEMMQNEIHELQEALGMFDETHRTTGSVRN